MDVNELVKIETMPKIFYQLEQIGSEIDKKLEDINELQCTEENKKEIKTRRAEINKFTKAMEDKRIEIKKKILEDYDIFNEKYENEVKNKLTNASETLKNKIDEIESYQKEEKINNLKIFAEEHIIANNLQSIITFDDMNLNVTLSASETSLKNSVVEYCEKVKNDIDLINMEEFKDEILVEYNKTKDFISSKKIVIQRHAELEKIREQEKEIQLKIDEEDKIIEAVDEIIAPKELENLIRVQFTIEASKDQIKRLKIWLESENIKYE